MRRVTNDFFYKLKDLTPLDETDWILAQKHSEKWQMSLADALIDLHYASESAVAQALAQSAGLNYVCGQELKDEDVEIESADLDSLLQVGALPLSGGRLVVCNPQDDHRGFLGNILCEREICVSERSVIYKFLRSFGLTQLARLI